MHLLELGERVSLDSLPKVQLSIQPITTLKNGDSIKNKKKLDIISESRSSGIQQLDFDQSAARAKRSHSVNNLKGTSKSSSNRSSRASENENTSTQRAFHDNLNDDKSTNNRTETIPTENFSGDTESYKSYSGDNSHDSAEFVELIKDYLFADRIHIVVNRIRSALDREKIVLDRRLNQLESFMESDCEVIVTNRSSSRSTSSKSTPRSNSFMIDENHDAIDCSGIYLECVGCGITFSSSDQENVSDSKRAIIAGQKGMQIDRNKMRERNVELDVLCIGCRARIRDINQSEQTNLGRDINTDRTDSTNCRSSSSSSSSTGLGESSASSEKTGINHPSRKPSGPSLSRSADSDPLPASQHSGSVGALSGRLEAQPRSSKFRNKLQAARDEHHFLADDYSMR